MSGATQIEYTLMGCFFSIVVFHENKNAELMLGRWQ